MSRRKPQRFTRLGGQIKPLRFIAFDIETYTSGPKKGKFMFGGVYDGDDYILFTNREKMKLFMTNEHFAGSIFVAHNAEYDLNRIFYFDNRLERYVLGSRLIFAKYALKNGKRKDGSQVYRYIKYWDSFNFSFCSLARIGQILGLPKSEIEHDNTISPEYIDYNRQDCVIVWEFMQRFQRKINGLGGQVRTSLAGCSMDLFRRFFMSEDAGYWKLKSDVKENFRQAYYGGRTEVFNLAEHHDVRYYDINSSYPYAMTQDFPLLDTWKNGVNLDRDGCTLVDVEVPETQYPVLPLRLEKNIFPIGKWRAWYFNNELRYAESQGVKLRPIRGIHYEKSEPIFRDFILKMYNERKAAESKTENFIFKTLMNALYGRFAMRNSLEIFRGRAREIVSTENISSNVIWSGMITAIGRINLHKLIKRTDSIYCDTDSSMTKKNLRKVSVDLGGVSLEKKFRTFKANNPKDYEFVDYEGRVKRKLKGVPSRAIETSPNHFTYEIPVKFKTSIRRGIDIHKWIQVDKVLSTWYDKRVVLKDGSTVPHEVEGNGKRWLAKRGQEKGRAGQKRRSARAGNSAAKNRTAVRPKRRAS